jgi:hypothetical protein
MRVSDDPNLNIVHHPNAEIGELQSFLGDKSGRKVVFSRLNSSATLPAPLMA